MPRDGHAEALDALRDAIAHLRGRNKEKLHDLKRFGEAPSPVAITMTKIDALIGVLCGDDEEARLRIEYEFERRMVTVLAGAISRATARRLEVHDKDGMAGGLFLGP